MFAVERVQKDHAAVRAEIEDLARSEAHCRALEARVTVLETDARRHEWQRQAADDLAVQYIMVTSPVTVRVQEMPTTLTTRRAPDQVRNLFVLNAEFKDTTERNVQG
ncbi:hypothetical protein Tco_0388183 [Tanacetum coccineum]